MKIQATVGALADAATTTTPVVVDERASDVRQAVRVKPLVWDDLGDGRAYRAKAPLFGSIRVEAYYSGGFHVLWSVPGFCDIFTPGLYASADLAQAAAQADYTSRITAALEPDPTPALGWKAMQTAAAEACNKRGAQEQRDYGLDRSAQNCFRCRDDVRTLPGPTDEQLLAEAVKLLLADKRAFAAMVDAAEEIHETGVSFNVVIGDALRAALAKIGEAK